MHRACRTVPALALALASLALPSAGEARVDLTSQPPCGFTLTFNLQFYGAADSATVDSMKADILNCWSGHRYGCCPLTVVVNTLIGGPRTTGYDSILVVDDPEGTFASECHLGHVNEAGDVAGRWSNNLGANRNTYAHEVGHLCNLEDRYRVVSGGIKMVDGAEVDCRRTAPMPGFEMDKMATLSGKVTPFMLRAIAHQAGGVHCPESCWPPDIAGMEASFGIQEPSAPLPRPGTQGSIVYVLPEAFGATFVYYPSQEAGGGLKFANMSGVVEIEIVPPGPLDLHPNQDLDAAYFQVGSASYTIGSFEAAPGQFTGPNLLELVELEQLPPGIAVRAHGVIGNQPPGSAPGMSGLSAYVNDGFFVGTMPMRLVNDLYPPSAPAFIEVSFLGQIDYDTGSGFLFLELNPFLFLPVSGTPGGPETRPGLALAQNFPNPAEFATHIRFRVDEPGPVRLEVFDASGRLVRTLLDGPVPAGTHTRRWDLTDDAGRGVGAGIYFLSATAGDERRSRRLVVAR